MSYLVRIPDEYIRAWAADRPGPCDTALRMPDDEIAAEARRRVYLETMTRDSAAFAAAGGYWFTPARPRIEIRPYLMKRADYEILHSDATT